MSPSTVHYPRFRVTVNGSVLQGISNVTITQANAFQIANFCFTKGFVPEDAFPSSWWAATSNNNILVTIELSVDGTQFFPMITGKVDSYRYDAFSNSISPVGRDLAAEMIDTRIVTTFRNLTASEIAMQLAAKHGLQTNITPTKTIVGRFYDVDHDETSSGDFSQVTNEWDLLCRLGESEGIIPYVFGMTLYFNPPVNSPPTYPIALTRNSNGLLVANITGLLLDRHMTYARDVIVKVKSWNSRSKMAIASTVRTKAIADDGATTVRPTIFLYEIPNLTQTQCLAKAQQLALAISQHERKALITIPSLALMDPQTVIPLSGTNTDYDGVYFPLKITYELTTEAGAKTIVDAKRSSPLETFDNDTGQKLEIVQ